MSVGEENTILESFQPVSLSALDKVKLLNRTDTKFMFSRNRLTDILAQLTRHYFILETSGRRIAVYETLYFDTPGLRFYHEHQKGKLNRLKIRHRMYADNGVGFLEVKLKTNTGRTIKSRIQENSRDIQANPRFAAFIAAHAPVSAADLIPTVLVKYRRITLASFNMDERVTIDLDLSFTSGTVTADYHHLVIAEVKQNRKTTSDFTRIMKQLHIREGSVSKYCLGIISTHRSVKKNNFKPGLISINKLTHDN